MIWGLAWEKARVTDQDGQSRSTRVNVMIKVVISIILKPNLEVDRCKVQVLG
jgi:hypothetical protein